MLVYYFKEKGTAIATLVTETCMTGLTCIFAYRVFSFRISVKTAWQTGIALLPLVLLILWCKNEFTNPVAILFCSALPGMLLYGLLQLLVFKNDFLKEAFLQLRWGRKLSIPNG